MLKLVDCNNFWSPSGGGVRRYHLEKIDYFKNRSDVQYTMIMHDTKTYTEQITKTLSIEHLKVPKVPGNWEYRYLWNYKILEPLINKLNPDIIEVGSPYFMPKMVQKIIRKNNLKAKVFGFWHADFPVTYVRRFVQSKLPSMAGRCENFAWNYARKNYNKMNGVICASQVIAERMYQNGVQNISFIPLGVNCQVFHPHQRNDALIKRFKGKARRKIFMFFPHRFSYEKGVHLILAAYPKLCELLPEPPALVFAGTGPLQKDIEVAAAQYPDIHFIGYIKNKKEMAEYYASADLGFALSAWETFGLSLAESLSCGLPLIAANDGAAKEHIEKSNAGLILAELSVDQLVDKIVEFSKRPDLHLMKKRAVEYATQLTWKACFNQQVRLYQNAVNQI